MEIFDNFADAEYSKLDTSRAVIARSLEWPEAYEHAPHFHNYSQLVYCSEGVMNVATPKGTWVVLPKLAVWVPANVAHTIRAETSVSFRSIYVDPAAAPWLPQRCCVIKVSSFLRGLILEAMEVPHLYQLGGRDERLMNLILDEVSGISAIIGNLHLPEPTDRRIRPLADAILSNPADGRSLEDWSAVIGVSGRTIHRIFVSETGMAFGQWKRQAVLMEAIRKLDGGEAVTTVASDLGYDSPSAFSAMFRRTLGVTPGTLLR